MRVIGALLLTLSAITPASSVFVIVQGVIKQAGTGAFLACLPQRFWPCLLPMSMPNFRPHFQSPAANPARRAVLWAAVPALRSWASRWRATCSRRRCLRSVRATTSPLSFLGLDQIAVAITIIAVTTLLGILHIRTNAWVTGIFLLLELLALAVLTGLGLWNVERSLWDVVAHPVMFERRHCMRRRLP